MKIINLNQHPITLVRDGGEQTVFPPAGEPARLSTSITGSGMIRERALEGIIGLPEPEFDTVFVVSSMVMAAACQRGRRDVVSPDGFIRDSSGRITGCQYFVREVEQ